MDVNAYLRGMSKADLSEVRKVADEIIRVRNAEQQRVVWRVMDGDGNEYGVYPEHGYLDAAKCLLSAAEENAAAQQPLPLNQKTLHLRVILVPESEYRDWINEGETHMASSQEMARQARQ